MSVSPLMEEGDIVPVDRAALLDYTLSNNGRVDALADSYMDYFNRHSANSIGSRALSLDNWARKKYHFGALRSNTYAEGEVDLKEEMDFFLTERYVGPITVQYAKFGPVNNNHFVYKILIDNFGFDIKSNQVVTETTRIGKTVYLEDFKIVYCPATLEDVINPDYLNPLGYAAKSGKTHSRSENRNVSHTPWEKDESATEDYALVTFSYFNGSEEVKYSIRIDFLSYEFSGTKDIPEAGEAGTNVPVSQTIEEDEPDYFMVRYADGSGSIKLFTYKFGSGEYPALDTLFLRQVDLGRHIPNLYIRLNGQDIYDRDKDDVEFKASKVYGNMLGMSYATACTELMDQIESKGDIKDMFFSFRLNPNDDDPIVAEYFYCLFEELYKTNGAKRTGSDNRTDKLTYIDAQAIGGMTYEVKDNYSQVNCTFTGLGYQDIVGSIGDIGTVTSSYNANEYKVPIAFSKVVGKLMRPRHVFRKQVSDNVYREYLVDGLSISQKLTSGHWTSASKDDDNLCIPVDIELIAKRMRKHRHWLVSKAFCVVITTVKVVKKKWYQTGIFKVFMFVIAVVISFFTAGQGMVWYLALAKAVAIAVVTQVAVQAISAVLTALGIDASIVAAIVAVVAIAVGAYAHAAKTTVGGLKATQLMAISNVSFGVSHNHIALNGKRALQAFEEFKDLMESEMDSIEEQRKLLGLEDGGKVDVYTLLAKQVRQPDIRLGESPLSFYERTLTVNAGLATTALLNNYVLISLQLPSFESFLAQRRMNNADLW